MKLQGFMFFGGFIVTKLVLSSHIDKVFMLGIRFFWHPLLYGQGIWL